MAKTLEEAYRQIIEASVLPNPANLKKPGIGPESGQVDLAKTGGPKMNMAKADSDALRNKMTTTQSYSDMAKTKTPADYAKAGLVSNTGRAPANISDQGARKSISGTNDVQTRLANARKNAPAFDPTQKTVTQSQAPMRQAQNRLELQKSVQAGRVGDPGKQNFIQNARAQKERDRVAGGDGSKYLPKGDMKNPVLAQSMKDRAKEVNDNARNQERRGTMYDMQRARAGVGNDRPKPGGAQAATPPATPRAKPEPIKVSDTEVMNSPEYKKALKSVGGNRAAKNIQVGQRVAGLGRFNAGDTITSRTRTQLAAKKNVGRELEENRRISFVKNLAEMIKDLRKKKLMELEQLPGGMGKFKGGADIQDMSGPNKPVNASEKEQHHVKEARSPMVSGGAQGKATLGKLESRVGGQIARGNQNIRGRNLAETEKEIGKTATGQKTKKGTETIDTKPEKSDETYF